MLAPFKRAFFNTVLMQCHEDMSMFSAHSITVCTTEKKHQRATLNECDADKEVLFSIFRCAMHSI